MSKTKSEKVTLGIDLGTTYCCVATYANGRVKVISNDQGQDTTPSYVTLMADDEDDVENDFKKELSDDFSNCFIGSPAKDAAMEYPQETIFDVKRLIGRKFTDPCVQRDMTFWPFEVTKDLNSLSPQIKVNDKLYTPEEISSKILFHLKRRAQEVLGNIEVKDVVITVPAYFNDGQRQATKDAGKIAGLNVLQIINEPTAAALAYNLHRKKPQRKINILVFDLGGGTFDVSVLTLENNIVKVLAVGGNTHLGGEDFDNVMVDHCLKEFKKEHNIDIHEIRRNLSKMENTLSQQNSKLKSKIIKSIRRIKNECEIQKQYLSATTRVVITMDEFYDGKMLRVPFTRELFETLNDKYFQECMRIVLDVLKNSKLSKEAIDEIVLVGGSSRIPKIQSMLEGLFGGKKVLNFIDKDLAVAHGAAIQAAALDVIEENEKIESKSNKDLKVNFPKSNTVSLIQERLPIVTDVVPLSIGVEVDKRLDDDTNFDVIIPKNASIPQSWNKEFATTANNVRSIRVNVFEGESRFTKDNHHLGNFILTDLPRCPQGEPIQVMMDVDREGILHVSARLPRRKIQNQIVISEHRGRLTDQQIEKLKEKHGHNYKAHVHL